MKLGVVFVILFIGVVYAIPGGWKIMKPEDPKAKEIANFATKVLSDRCNCINHKKLVRVIDAKRQLVAGLKYNLTMEIGSTVCRKNEVTAEQLDECALDTNTVNEMCTVSVWDQPWIPKRHLLDFHCESKSKEARPDKALFAKKAPKENSETVFGGGDHDKVAYQLSLFKEFMQRHNKSYKSEEEMKKRFQIFTLNLKKIELLNIHEKGTGKYGVTKFADLTEEEFRKHYLGLRPELSVTDIEPLAVKIPKGPIPSAFDWRDHNAVTEVKDQGSCGSCWAFSTTGNIEGMWAVKKKQLLSLSEQELVDCDTIDTGCNGGLPTNAYQQIMKLGGLETEKDYPYKGDDEKCIYNKTKAKVDISGYVGLPQNETELAMWLVNHGPISIGINANAMQFYFGGVSHPPKFLCSPKNLDHGVLIVGYGMSKYPLFKKDLPYWIVKNSWGKSWGEKGYYRVYRGSGTCGLNQMATSSWIEA